MKKKRTFVKPELREEASLAEVTLQSGGTIPDPCTDCIPT